MVVVKIFCGLGNQMFQYAFSKALIGYDCYLDFESKNHMVFYNIDYKDFNKSNCLRRLVFDASKKEVNDPIWERIEIKKIKSNSYFSGYWAYSHYFNRIRDQLILDFEIKNKSSIYKDAEAFVTTHQFTAIHVRRGDYLLSDNIAIFNNLGMDYYHRAIDYILKKDSDAHFLIFSNDIPWCKENFKAITNIKYISDLFSLKDFEELSLMAHCENIIIANSTFSWWAAYLIRSANAIIIRPKIWYNLDIAQNAYEKGELLFLHNSIAL